MVDRVQHHPAIGHAYFSVSEDGTLVFTRAPDAEGLRYFDRSGAVAATLTDLRSADVPRVSPDGTRVLTATFDAEKGSTDIYVVASDTGARTRLTSDPNWEEHPVWSPDSRRVAYRGSKGRPGLYVQNATGSDEQLLIEEAAADRLDPMDWSHDGQLLVNRWSPEAAEDLVLVPLEGSPTIRPWLATKSREFGGRFSPDGRLVAYTSNETGTNEIHIRAFADPAVTRRVTTSGGEHPIWSRDGRELFYLGPGGWVTAVPIRTAPVLEVGNPVRLFRRAGGGFSLEFDVDRSGRFLMSVIDNSMETSAFNVFHLVLNWPLLLKPRQ
jgi:Tol biopolymer transport system component